MKCSKYNFLLLYIILLIPKLCVMKLYKEDPEDNLEYYYNKYSYNENEYYYSEQKNNKNKIDENNFDIDEDNFQKPASTFEFYTTYIKNRVKAYFYGFHEYYDGLKFVLSKYKFLFRRFSPYKILNYTILNKKYTIDNNDESNDLIDHKFQRKLEQSIKRQMNDKKLGKDLEGSYPYNNTNLYDKINCPLIPDLKVYYYYYFCDGIRVSKEEYLNRTAHGEQCEFYNNTQKICFCPIHYSFCQFRTASKLKCMANKLLVNNEIELTKYRDTFNDEYMKIPILDNNKKIYEFSLNAKCGLELDDKISGSNVNFYLYNADLNYPDFDIISTEYHGAILNGTQYTKEEVLDNTTKILDYFIKKKNLILERKTNLYIKFSLIDQMWAIPYRYKLYEIEQEQIEDFLSGKINYKFTVDLDDLIKNEEGEGPFMRTESSKVKYPYFDKSDIHFFEIELVDNAFNQIRFIPLRGEMKK